uniref:RING-type domain-containing protein n=1 Tax=Panagrolaimus sp. ES5 TaxID=591445 RepID=A0AC34GR17_9BILA
MSSNSDYESASSSDFDEDFELVDGLQKQNFQLKKQNQELKSLLCNALNRLQIASISADETEFKLFDSNATTSHECFKKNCIKIIENLERNLLKTESSNGSSTCLLCCSQPKEYAFMPCFHLIACKECAEKCSECPICRKTVNSTLKIFMN